VDEGTWRCLPCGATNLRASPYCEMCGSPQPLPMDKPPPEEPWLADPAPFPDEFGTRPPPISHRDSGNGGRRFGPIIGLIIAVVLMVAGAVAIKLTLDQPAVPDTRSPPLAVPGTTAPPPELATQSGARPSGSPSVTPFGSPSPAASAPRSPLFPVPVPPGGSSPSASTPAPSPSTGPPETIGIVDVSEVNTNSHVAAVGGMFNTYFSAINAKQYTQALAVYDPAGGLNPNDPAQAAVFTNGVSTTTDDRIVLLSIVDDANHAGWVDTRVTFRSQQAVGYGPADAPDETCTLWDNTWRLSANGGGFRIFNLIRFSDSPC
jgi:hypothetical protein